MSVVTTTRPMMLCALGFTAAAMLVGFWPLTLPWVPLAAPVVVGAVYLIVLRPFVGRARWDVSPAREV